MSPKQQARGKMILYLWDTKTVGNLVYYFKPDFIVESWKDIASTMSLKNYLLGLKNLSGVRVILKDDYDGLEVSKELVDYLLYFSNAFSTFGGIYTPGNSPNFEKFYELADAIDIYTDIWGMLKVSDRSKVSVFTIRSADGVGTKILSHIVGKPKRVIKHFTVCGCGRATVQDILKWVKKYDRDNIEISIGYLLHNVCNRFKNPDEVVTTLRQLKALKGE